MKISKIADQLEEYKKLQTIKEDIQQVINGLLSSVKPFEEYTTGGIINCTLNFHNGSNQAMYLNSDSVKYIHADLVQFLSTKQSEIKRLQSELEV